MISGTPLRRSILGATIGLLFFAPVAGAATRSEVGYPRVMQGPMVGAVSAHDARIWVRLSGEYPVVVEYGADFRLTSFQTTEPVVAAKANDYTVVITIRDLKPATEYFYRLKVNNGLDRYLRDYPPFTFKTAPMAGAPTGFRVAFGSCARFSDDRIQPLWSVVSLFTPDLLLWLGDNIYGDALDPEILREEYRRLRDVVGLQPVIHNISNLAIWDDHDYGLNNHDRTNPIKDEALVIFKQYWANPSYGLDDVPGVFFSYSYGAVDFFFLDDRFYRDPDIDPDTPDKTQLGQAQLAWLKTELEQSTAVFKVLVSGGGWSSSKGPTGDSWAAFLNERNHIFDFIRDNEIGGVVLISGDSHVGELNVIPWSDHGGYDLYDLVGSPFAQQAPDNWLERRPERRIRPVYFQGSSIGIMDFVFGDSPRLIYRVIDIHGRNVWEPFEVRPSELVNGVVSWPTKVSDQERQRQEHYDQGRGYYEIPPVD